MSSAPFVRIAELPAHAGQPVVVRAWVTHVRSSGKIAFAVLRDGTGVCQTVFIKNQIPPAVWERFSHLTTETSVAVEGEARAEPRAPGGFEIGVTNLTIIGPSPIDYPIQPKEHGIDFLLDNQLAIKHLPPDSHVPAWAHFRENIYRFVYARAKLRGQVPVEGLRQVEISELDPYPGRCMGDDLEDLIYKTCVLTGLYFMHAALGVKPGMKAGMREETEFHESMNNIRLARYDAPPEDDPFTTYLELRASWEELMKFLASDETLAGELKAAF